MDKKRRNFPSNWILAVCIFLRSVFSDAISNRENYLWNFAGELFRWCEVERYEHRVSSRYSQIYWNKGHRVYDVQTARISKIVSAVCFFRTFLHLLPRSPYRNFISNLHRSTLQHKNKINTRCNSVLSSTSRYGCKSHVRIKIAFVWCEHTHWESELFSHLFFIVVSH